jgi:hypothetical protein
MDNIERLFDIETPNFIDDTLFKIRKEQIIEDSIEYSHNPKFKTHVQSDNLLAKQPDLYAVCKQHPTTTFRK